jgi:hypothetical protein
MTYTRFLWVLKFMTGMGICYILFAICGMTFADPNLWIIIFLWAFHSACGEQIEKEKLLKDFQTKAKEVIDEWGGK